MSVNLGVVWYAQQEIERKIFSLSAGLPGVITTTNMQMSKPIITENI